MLMKKLSEEHYIIVDDSDIKIGDIVAEKLLTGEYGLFEIHTLNDIDRQTQIKITHSTQPIEQYYAATEGTILFVCHKIIELPLSEVKELLGVVDVEKNIWYERNLQNPYPSDSPSNTGFKKGFELGYNQALEDNKEKKYTKEDMWAIFITGKQLGLTVSASIRNGSDKPNQEQYFNECIESRDPSTEWEVEIVDGKLKLKS